LFILGNYIFLNEVDKGVHIIDNAIPTQPRNIAFIDIPGNVDIAVKGTTLYADLYTDLVAIDISSPLQPKLTKVVENVFPHRYYNSFFSPDSGKVIVDWIQKDTTVTEDYTTSGWNRFENGRAFVTFASSADGAKSSASAAPGISGSMARFTIVDKRLYTVGMQELKVFNINDAARPFYVTEKQVGFNIETVYPFKDRLFIGSASGMFIYDISNVDQPQKLSEFSHVRSCDPVIADDKHAYVTLRSGTACMGFTNQLEVLNVSVLSQPVLLKTYQMKNPHGLSKDGNLLFICDGDDGLKVYDATLPTNLKLIKQIPNLQTFDVIAYTGVAIVVASDGLYQFGYSNPSNIQQLSKITISK
jgi:hypothetical protein